MKRNNWRDEWYNVQKLSNHGPWHYWSSLLTEETIWQISLKLLCRQRTKATPNPAGSGDFRSLYDSIQTYIIGPRLSICKLSFVRGSDAEGCQKPCLSPLNCWSAFAAQAITRTKPQHIIVLRNYPLKHRELRSAGLDYCNLRLLCKTWIFSDTINYLIWSKIYIVNTAGRYLSPYEKPDKCKGKLFLPSCTWQYEQCPPITSLFSFFLLGSCCCC